MTSSQTVWEYQIVNEENMNELAADGWQYVEQLAYNGDDYPFYRLQKRQFMFKRVQHNDHIKNKFDSLGKRISKLTEECAAKDQMIESLKAIVATLQKKQLSSDSEKTHRSEGPALTLWELFMEMIKSMEPKS